MTLFFSVYLCISIEKKMILLIIHSALLISSCFSYTFILAYMISMFMFENIQFHKELTQKIRNNFLLFVGVLRLLKVLYLPNDVCLTCHYTLFIDIILVFIIYQKKLESIND